MRLLPFYLIFLGLSLGCGASEKRSPKKDEVIAAMRTVASEVSACYGPAAFDVKVVFDGETGDLVEVEEITPRGPELSEEQEACVHRELVNKVNVGTFDRNKHLLSNGQYRVVYPFKQK